MKKLLRSAVCAALVGSCAAWNMSRESLAGYAWSTDLNKWAPEKCYDAVRVPSGPIFQESLHHVTPSELYDLTQSLWAMGTRARHGLADVKVPDGELFEFVKNAKPVDPTDELYQKHGMYNNGWTWQYSQFYVARAGQKYDITYPGYPANILNARGQQVHADTSAEATFNQQCGIQLPKEEFFGNYVIIRADYDFASARRRFRWETEIIQKTTPHFSEAKWIQQELIANETNSDWRIRITAHDSRLDRTAYNALFGPEEEIICDRTNFDYCSDKIVDVVAYAIQLKDYPINFDCEAGVSCARMQVTDDWTGGWVPSLLASPPASGFVTMVERHSAKRHTMAAQMLMSTAAVGILKRPYPFVLGSRAQDEYARDRNSYGVAQRLYIKQYLDCDFEPPIDDLAYPYFCNHCEMLPYNDYWPLYEHVPTDMVIPGKFLYEARIEPVCTASESGVSYGGERTIYTENVHVKVEYGVWWDKFFNLHPKRTLVCEFASLMNCNGDHYMTYCNQNMTKAELHRVGDQLDFHLEFSDFSFGHQFLYTAQADRVKCSYDHFPNRACPAMIFVHAWSAEDPLNAGEMISTVINIPQATEWMTHDMEFRKPYNLRNTPLPLSYCNWS